MIWKPAILLGLACVVAGCGALPRGAAQQSEILRSAPDAEVSVYEVSRALLPSVATWPRLGPDRPAWLGHSPGTNARVLRPGDRVAITIWDNAPNSLLTAPGQRSTGLGEMQVSSTGQVFMPYVGSVAIAGLDPEAARARLQSALETIAPSAQVQLSMSEGRGNTVELISGVARPGPVPMPDQNFTVLSALASGGGVANNLQNPQIRLMRGNRSHVTSIADLYARADYDVALRAGDQLIVEEDPRYFMSLGATGSEKLHGFPRDRVTALDAVAIIGGVADNRADLNGVLILREYPATAIAPGMRGPQSARVIFTMDLTKADGLFSARNFEVMNGDLVFAAESPVTMLQTVLNLIGSGVGLATRIDNVSN